MASVPDGAVLASRRWEASVLEFPVDKNVRRPTMEIVVSQDTRLNLPLATKSLVAHQQKSLSPEEDAPRRPMKVITAQ
ncbi:MAG: hypothetical protein INR71_11290 [Terriglobus roseus]|nr:hypothetical protein [Terriglobus roseus]